MQMRNIKLGKIAALLGLTLSIVLSGCGGTAATAPTQSASDQPTAAAGQPTTAGSTSGGTTDPKVALAGLATKVYSTGPYGETPAAATDITLTDAEIAKVK